MTTATYSKARASFAKYLDEVTEDGEIVIVERRGREPVAMIAKSELDGLMETTHLLRSPRNAARLLGALQRSRSKGGKRVSLPKLEALLGP